MKIVLLFIGIVVVVVMVVVHLAVQAKQ